MEVARIGKMQGGKKRRGGSFKGWGREGVNFNRFKYYLSFGSQMLVSVQSITVTAPPATVDEGSDVKVMCVTDGSKPAPEIVWVKQGLLNFHPFGVLSCR